MKSIYKTLFTLSLVLALGFVANAQSTASATATATATASILADLNINKTADIAFGNVNKGVKPSLDPATGLSSGVNFGTTSLGKFEVTGSPGASVTVTFDEVTMESNDYQAPDLKFTPEVTRTNVSTALFGGTVIKTADPYTVNTVSSVEIAPGTDYFFVGGTLSTSDDKVIPATANGTYTGTFTLTVTYN